jgi:hypothetical protein
MNLHFLVKINNSVIKGLTIKVNYGTNKTKKTEKETRSNTD